MRKLLLTALAMLPLAAPVTAFAATWYVLNYGTKKARLRQQSYTEAASPRSHPQVLSKPL